jgi:hypothetical protein
MIIINNKIMVFVIGIVIGSISIITFGATAIYYWNKKKNENVDNLGTYSYVSVDPPAYTWD